MKLKHILFCLGALTLPALSGNAAADILDKFQFDETSYLASGNWVKIEVPETGIYEISYDQLRKMGFSNPSAVSVFGYGGDALGFNVTDSSGNPVYSDNPPQQPVLHLDNKLVFYGIGPATIKAEALPTGECIKFERTGKNIYSHMSHYFLSDAIQVRDPEVRKVADKNIATLKKKGYTYQYHEVDLTQAAEGTGNIFWGEPIKYGSPLEFTITQPYSVDGNLYVCSYVAASASSKGTVTLSINNLGRNFNVGTSTSSVKSHTFESSSAKLKIDANGVGTASFKYSVNDLFTGNILALDWWTMACPVDLSLAKADTFDQMYFALRASKGQAWKMQVPDNSLVWDITGNRIPVALEVVDGYAYGSATDTSDELIVFNPAKPMKKIGANWERVANQNLHAMRNDGTELLIFSTVDMLPYAKGIAEAHEKYDGIKTAVVTPPELYNEFSAGSPDPQAYRIMAKMLNQNSKSLKNILFIGKQSADIRNLRGTPEYTDSHIAYIMPQTDIESLAISVSDYFGCVTDYLEKPENLKNAPITIGVGLLPVSTHEEGANVLAKIREYLSKEDFSNIVNETMMLACEGDNNLHVTQAAQYANLLQNLNETNFNSKFSNSQIRFDQLEIPVIKQQYHDALGRGKLYSLYYGHSIEFALNGTAAPININDLMDLDNKELSFFFIAGCEVAYPDQGRQGVGDIGVTRAKRGFIGTLMASRKVMSNDNENLAKSFIRGFYYDDRNALRTSTPTIGEVLAQAKNGESSPSQLAFMLIGDPALRLPFPLGSVKVDVEGSAVRHKDVITVKGQVLDRSNNVNADYNGFVTVKLMEPSRKDIVPVKVSNSDEYLSSMISDLRMATVKGEVKNGEFTVTIPVPEKCEEFMSSEYVTTELPIYVGTYDPTSRLACSGYATVTTAVDGSEPDDETPRDTEAPKCSVTYDNLMQTLTVTVTDNVALRPGIGNGAALSVGIGSHQYVVPSDESDDVATTSYTGTISTANLQPGTYFVTCQATDLAGNTNNEFSTQFTVSAVKPLELSTLKDYAIDEMQFQIKGDMAGETCELVVIDNSGKKVLTDEVSGSRFTCDLSELPAGLYKATVRHNSPKGARLYSNWVEFTVID